MDGERVKVLVWLRGKKDVGTGKVSKKERGGREGKKKDRASTSTTSSNGPKKWTGMATRSAGIQGGSMPSKL